MKARTLMIAAAFSMGAMAMHVMAQDADSQTPLASNFAYNFYTQPGASQVTAGMYPAPHYVPSHVGQTYFTYQPLLPHEHLYEHSRTYYNYYAGPETFYRDPCCAHPTGYGLNKTTVIWQNGCSHVGHSPLSWTRIQDAQYRFASRKYCLNGGSNGFGFRGGCGGCASGGCQ